MVRDLHASSAAKKRIAALEWEANCERMTHALSQEVRGDASEKLLVAIRRARELLAELEQLHMGTTQSEPSDG